MIFVQVGNLRVTVNDDGTSEISGVVRTVRRVLRSVWVCRAHGILYQSPSEHRKSGCYKCLFVDKRMIEENA
jgi:hypothetical protein